MSEYKITVEVKSAKQSEKATKASKGGTPKTNNEVTSPKNKSTQEGSKNHSVSAQTIASMVRNPASALRTLGKSIPYIGAAIVAGQIATQVTDYALDISSTLTGDYSAKMQWNNFKGALKAVTNPIQSALSYGKWEAERYRANVSQSLQRELMGVADLGGEGTLKL